MKRISLMGVAAVAVWAAGLAAAQGAPGPQSPGPGASAPGVGMGPGGDSMMGRRGHMARYGKDDTPGWSLMTSKEREEHRRQMRSMHSYDECTAYRDRHHEQMLARAKERGSKPLPAPRRDACAPLKR